MVYLNLFRISDFGFRIFCWMDLFAWSWLSWVPWPSSAWWSEVWNHTEYGLVWMVTVILLVVGLVGTVLPVLPGPILILGAAIWHALATRYWLHVADPGIGWPGIIVLALFTATAQVFETVSSAMGAKFFGSTKWGAWGALLGGLVGLLFFPWGIFLGPVLGALSAELIIAKRELKPAAKSTWGTFLGTAFGLIVKTGIGLAMVGYFFLDVFTLRW
jgi:uncharacterized protein YqgC (DUF456 family)